MWIYESVTRHEFESIKDKVEKFIIMLGGNKVSVDFPYEQKTCSYIGNEVIANVSPRTVFEYGGEYYRVDEVCFKDKPFIVIECGTYDDLMNNSMEDADPFPYDLSDDELVNEVKYTLGIESYPKE